MNLTVKEIKEYKSRVYSKDEIDTACLYRVYAKIKTLDARNLPEKLELQRKFQYEFDTASFDEQKAIREKLLKYLF